MNSRGYFVRDASVRSSAWREAWLVLACTAGILCCTQPILNKFFHSTKGIGWETPEGSESVVANNHLMHVFPQRLRGAIVMAVEALPETASVLTNSVETFSKDVHRKILQDSRVQAYAPVVIGYYLDISGHAPPQKIRKELVSPDQRMTLIIIQPTKKEGSWSDANSLLEEFCTSSPQGYTLHISGIPAVLSGDGCYAGVHASVNTRDMNFECLFYAEICTLPVALVILGCLVKYPRLLPLPVLTVLTTFVVASLLMTPLMDFVAVPVDAPAAMGSLIMAICMDYSLFVLSRFVEQQKEGMSLQSNLDKINRYTLRTITVSGMLVAIALGGSIFFPERNMQGTGVCLAVATVAGVLTNNTVLPAVLLVAGNFLTGRKPQTTVTSGDELQGYSGDDGHSNIMQTPSQRHRERSCWLSVMRCVDRAPLLAVGAVLLFIWPALQHAVKLNVTADSFAVLPMNIPAVSALRRIQHSFPVGILEPFAVLITAPQQGSSTDLKEELKDGASSVGQHDVKTFALNMGLRPDEAHTAATVVAEVNDAIDRAELTPGRVDPKIVGAARAGAASAHQKLLGASDDDALRAALRAAKEANNTPAEIQQAVAAATAELCNNNRCNGKSSSDITKALKTEAQKLGLDAAAVADVVNSAEQAIHGKNVSQSSLAAAKAGAAAGQARFRGNREVDVLKGSLHALKGANIPAGDAAQVLDAVAGLSHQGTEKLKGSKPADGVFAAAIIREIANRAGQKPGADVPVLQVLSNSSKEQAATSSQVAVDTMVGESSKLKLDGAFDKLPVILDLVDVILNMSAPDHGKLLMPSGYKAMLDLCELLDSEIGSVASMLGPTWVLHDRMDWATSVALNMNSTARMLYNGLLASHVNGRHALLEVHTTFPSIGAGSANWVLAVRKALVAWEKTHPGFKAELSGGASEAADTRTTITGSLWFYLANTVFWTMCIVYKSFSSIMIPVRLGFALLFTLAATFGTGAIIYQTTLLHGVFPRLADFDGISFEVVPIVTGVAIALGLDYDIFLVSRIVEFRVHRYSDRASIFRAVLKTGDVISGAGLIMSLAFTGLCFSDKLLFQQMGVLLIISVLFDTFIVRTILVPALMLIAQGWNWWPRDMPPAIHDTCEGEVASEGGLSKPILEGTAMESVGPYMSYQAGSEERYNTHGGMIA